jgi:hypothetical protein
MRKIISKQEETRKKKRNQLIVGFALIFIMLLSVLGYSFSGGSESTTKIKYNGFNFIKQEDFWVLNIENFNFIFKNNPNQVEKINSDLKNLENYYGKPLYMYSENYEAELEIYKNLFYYNQIVQRMQDACLEGNQTDCDETLPVKNCEDNFIIIRERNETKIIQENNCVFIEGKQEELTKITDEFLFKILGIEE